MATAVQIPVSEYLATTYHPKREYVDGELRERKIGRWNHARLQALLAAWLADHESAWNIIGACGPHIRVSPARVRIPDLVVLRPGPQPDVLIDPPLLVVEILSPDDTYSELQERCADYSHMGVETIWLIDPTTRSGRMCSRADWIAAERLEVPGTPIHVHLSPLFAQLQSQAQP